MAFTRLSGGGNPLNKSFNVTRITINDATSFNVTVPSGTDFLILLQASYASNYSTTAGNCNGKMIGFVDEIGGSVSLDSNFFDGFNSSSSSKLNGPSATLTWTNTTSARVTRANSTGWAWVLACKYN